MLAVETLMAVTGIFPGVSHPSQNDLLAAQGLAQRWESRIRRWLSATDSEDYQPRTFEAPEPPDEQSKLQDKILKPIEGDEQARILSAFEDPEGASVYLEAIKGARAYLDGKWSKIPVPGAVDEVFPLSPQEYEDIWSLVRIVDDPDILFDELESESLSIPMIEAWRACYPELSAEVMGMIGKVVIERKAKKKRLTWQQQDLIHMLAGEPLEAPIVIAKAEPKQPSKGA